MRFEIELPLPPADAGGNFRGTTQSRKRQTRIAHYRKNCARTFLGCKLPAAAGPVTVHLDYYLCRDLNYPAARLAYLNKCYFPRDRDGARYGAKSAQDALQDAGVIVSDAAARVIDGNTNIWSKKEDHKGRTCLVMTLEYEPKPLEVKTNDRKLGKSTTAQANNGDAAKGKRSGKRAG